MGARIAAEGEGVVGDGYLPNSGRAGILTAPWNLSAVVVLCLVVGSTLERSTIGFGGFSFYMSHLVMIILAPLVLVSLAKIDIAFSMCLLFSGVVCLCALPAIIIYGTAGRVGLVLQILANVFLFLTTLLVLTSVDLRQLRFIVAVATAFMVFGCILQVALFPALSAASGERFVGLARPVILFTEPTWVALCSSLLLSVALTLKMERCATVLAVIVLIVFTRSALIIGVSAVLVACFSIARTKLFVTLVVAACTVFSSVFVFRAISADNRIAAVTSLDTRQLDIFVVKAANGGSLSIWGSQVIRVFDPVRNRLVPSTSNVLFFDLFWKFGIGGVAILGVWCLVFSWFLPRRYGASFSDPLTLPAFIALALLPAVMQLNNAFGRPWLWVLVALLLASIASVNRRSNTLDQPAPPRESVDKF